MLLRKYLFFIILCCIFLLFNFKSNKDSKKIIYPEFINEKEVIIKGYSLDAMEPFITRDGKFLFFNSLNDGVDTSLYYAEKINDTIFKFKGEIKGVNGSNPHLDAVASMDLNNNFYFVSTRNYPEVFENYQSGEFINGEVKKINPVSGDFYNYSPGWLIMDAEIGHDGNLLYYVNAKFSGKPIPDEALLGIAEKIGVKFIKIENSDEILKNINNLKYLIYAPSISADQKELYFTRIKKGTYVTEICVAVRSNIDEAFSKPEKIEIPGIIVEAPSISNDGNKLYYHKKTNINDKYKIFSMERK